MIRLRGLRPGKDIAIQYTGLRPGEKLSEELLFTSEQVVPTEHPEIVAARDEEVPNLRELEAQIDVLCRTASRGDRAEAKAQLAFLAAGEPLDEIKALESPIPAVRRRLPLQGPPR